MQCDTFFTITAFCFISTRFYYFLQIFFRNLTKTSRNTIIITNLIPFLMLQVDLRLPTAKFSLVADSKQRAKNGGTVLPRSPETFGHPRSKFKLGWVCMCPTIIAHLYVFDRAQGQKRLDRLSSGLRSCQHHYVVL